MGEGKELPGHKEPTQRERQALKILGEGRPLEAARVFKLEAARRARKGDYEGAAWDWFTVGGILRTLQDHLKEAAQAYENAGSLFHKANSREGVKLTLLRYAQVKLALREYDEARVPARLALDMARQDKDKKVFIDSMITLWSALHATGDPGLQEFLEEVSKDPVIEGDQAVKEEFLLLSRDVEELGKDFERRLLASDNKVLLVHYYNRKGMKELQKGRLGEAIEYLTLGRHLAAQTGDVLGYFLNVTGLILAFELKGDRHGALQALLVGAASLREVLGSQLDEYFYMVFDALRILWGEEEMDKLMDEVTQRLGMEKGKDGTERETP